MNDEELPFREDFIKALTGQPRFVTPLPRRIRVRLWFHRRVDDVAYWLVCHDHCTAARRLYQACGMW